MVAKYHAPANDRHHKAACLLIITKPSKTQAKCICILLK